MAINLEQANSGTFVLTKVGLATGTTASQLATTAAATYVIDGVHRPSKAATASFPLTGITGYPLVSIPVGLKSLFGVWLDAAGNFTVTQGPLTSVNSNADLALLPPNPGNRAMVGVVSVYVTAAAAGPFVPNTTAFTATGITTGFFDTFALPGQGF